MKDELIEQVAQAIDGCLDNPSPRLTKGMTDDEVRAVITDQLARAALSIAHPTILEEAAKVADEHSHAEQVLAVEGLTNPRPYGDIQDSMHSNGADVADRIAAAIRALAHTTGQEK